VRPRAPPSYEPLGEQGVLKRLPAACPHQLLEPLSLSWLGPGRLASLPDPPGLTGPIGHRSHSRPAVPGARPHSTTALPDRHVRPPRPGTPRQLSLCTGGSRCGPPTRSMSTRATTSASMKRGRALDAIWSGCSLGGQRRWAAARSARKPRAHRSTSLVRTTWRIEHIRCLASAGSRSRASASPGETLSNFLALTG